MTPSGLTVPHQQGTPVRRFVLSMDADQRVDGARVAAEVGEFCRILASVLRRRFQREVGMGEDNRPVDRSDREHEGKRKEAEDG